MVIASVASIRFPKGYTPWAGVRGKPPARVSASTQPYRTTPDSGSWRGGAARLAGSNGTPERSPAMP